VGQVGNLRPIGGALWVRAFASAALVCKLAPLSTPLPISWLILSRL